MVAWEIEGAHGHFGTQRTTQAGEAACAGAMTRT
jgi:hypothetical protein